MSEFIGLFKRVSLTLLLAAALYFSKNKICVEIALGYYEGISVVVLLEIVFRYIGCSKEVRHSLFLFYSGYVVLATAVFCLSHILGGGVVSSFYLLGRLGYFMAPALMIWLNGPDHPPRWRKKIEDKLTEIQMRLIGKMKIATARKV